MRRISPLKLLMPLALFPFIAFGQQGNNSTSRQVETEALRYFSDAGVRSLIFTGKDQSPLEKMTQSMYLRHKGFVEVDMWGKEIYPLALPERETFALGKLSYDGVVYDSIEMRLDLYRDQVSILTPDLKFSIVLEPGKFDWASFHDYQIFFLENYESPELSAGYYLLLHGGDYPVYKKESYFFNRRELKFVNRSRRYWVEVNGEFFRIKSKGNLLKLFPSHRKELERFIRENQIKMSGELEDPIVRIVQQAEKLEKGGAL